MDKSYTYLMPFKDEISRCIKCGVCMTGCPTYSITKDETMVARGRITLAGATLNERIEASYKLEESITSCIGCLTCDVNCPSGVKIGEIIFAAKAQIAKTRGMNLLGRIACRLIRLRWPLPIITRVAAIPMKIYEWIPANNSLGRLLPFVKNNIKRKLPDTGKVSLTSQYPEVVKTMSRVKKGTVAFFPGCVIDMSTQDIGRATINVLNKLGYDVMIPKGQYCCGSPLRSLGNTEMAIKVAMKNLDIFSPLDVEAIIVSCATCGHTLKKEYPVLLNHSLNGEFKKVMAFSEKIMDIHEFLYKTPPPLSPLPQGDEQYRVTFHDPCHLKKGLGISQYPRAILRAIPSVEFIEMPEADACCGFGGIFSLYYYDLASEIGQRKAENIKRTGSDIVVTGCPGCKIHIEDSLQRAGYNAKVRHTVELLDEVLD